MYSDVLKNIKVQVKTTVATFWATLGNFGHYFIIWVLFHHLVTLSARLILYFSHIRDWKLTKNVGFRLGPQHTKLDLLISIKIQIGSNANS